MKATSTRGDDVDGQRDGDRPAHASRGPRGRSIAARTARWGAALRLARRDVGRHRGRTAIVLALIGLPVVAVSFLSAFLLSAAGTPLTRAELTLGPEAQAYVTDAGCGGCAVTQTDDGTGMGMGGPVAGDEEPSTERIEQALGGRAVVVQEGGQRSVLSAHEEPRAAGGVSVRAVDAAAAPRVYATREGRLPETTAEAAVARTLATRLGIEPGDTFEVDGTAMTAVGILDSRRRDVPEVLLVPGAVPLGVEGWFVLGDDPVTATDADALNAIGTGVVSRALVRDPRPAPAGFESYVGPVGERVQAAGIAAAVVAIALIEAVLLIGPAFAVGARRQTRQLALVAASGGTARDLRRIVLSSGLVLGVLAGVLGAALGTAVLGVVALVMSVGWTPLPTVVVPWWGVAGPAVLALLLGLLAAWIPARTASRLDVVAALAGRRADAAPARRTPWAGVVLTVMGLAAAVLGGATSRIVPLVAGIVVLEVGMILATGGLLTLVARLAGRLGVAGRFAVRDAVRQRSRTVPAIASIMAAVGAVTAGAVYAASSERVDEALYVPLAGVGTITVTTDYERPPDEVAPAVEAMLARVADEVPVMGTAVVHGLGSAQASPFRGLPWPEVLPRPDRECPWTQATSEAEVRALGSDPRCQGRGWSSFTGSAHSSGTIVDDGTVTRLFTGQGSEAAADALAAGFIVVNHPDDVWEDGTAHVRITTPDPEDPAGEGDVVELVAPAHLVGWDAGHLILPTSLVAQHALETVPIAGVARSELAYDQEWADALTAISGDTWVDVEAPFRSSVGINVLALVAVAAVVALAATWLSIGLAAAEVRPDLATLAAVGAPARVRRAVAAAQAAVIAVLGVWGGVLLGLAIGWALAHWSISADGMVPSLVGRGLEVPGVVVPWGWVALIGLAIPAVAVAGSWLTAPRHLPLARRLAQ